MITTLPVIIVNYQKKATSAQVKKVYSTFSNALRLAALNNGEWYYLDLNYGSYQGLKEFAENYLFPYLNVGQICEYGKDDVCNYQYSSKSKYNSYGIPNISFYKDSSKYAFALADGSTYVLQNNGNSFVGPKGSGIFVLVDINGNKKPNRWGRDVFNFEIYETSPGTLAFLPVAYYMFTLYSREDLVKQCKTFARGSCSTLLMTDGFEIKDDYPW